MVGSMSFDHPVPIVCLESESCNLILLESSSSSQGFNLKGWVVSARNWGSLSFLLDCLFTSSLWFSFILLQKHEVRGLIFLVPLTRIYFPPKIIVAPQKEFLPQWFSYRLFLMCPCEYAVTHANVWAAYHIPQCSSYLSKSCLPLVS